MAGLRVTSEELAVMVEAYKGGASGKEAAALCGRSPRTFYGAFKRVGGQIHKHYNRKYSVDDSFFDVIDSEEKAYWLGMIATDGCISRDRVCLWLAEEDREHIEKFKIAISAQNPIYTKTDRGFVSFGIEIYSKELALALKRLGVTEKKSLTIRPPTEISDMYIHHFWRGCVDGDGSIDIKYPNKNDRERINGAVSIYGNEWMVGGFHDFMVAQLETCASPHKRKDNGLSCVKYGGVGLPQMALKILYRNATVYLDRKKKTADTILAIESRKPYRSKIKKEQLVTAYNKLGVWNEVARQLDIPIGSMSSLKRKFDLCKLTVM